MDPRSERTVRLLQDAVTTLVSERDLGDISVSALAAAADVNRSSFYQHYERIEDVLADALDRELEAVDADFRVVDPRPHTPPPETLVRYLTVVDENRTLYRRALGAHGSPQALSRLLHRLEGSTKRALTALSGSHTTVDIPIDVIAAATAGSVLGMIVHWVESDAPASVDQQARWIWSYLTEERLTHQVRP
ncbi:DNA-binding transcriptional regulator, AcrR family [Paraoerskovia marina]|uniref:DNA-binding transcriptional regulator, AcrR family n=1 Tax=Paraoerskovia marina TaxID=545619 RepID=A0A1H1VPT7_9CELL|nr:DNA-binding transcriptional regulator, AcrR family [Paraoerskovia marina]